MKSFVVLKIDNDTYFEMPLLEGYLAGYGVKLVESSLAQALPAISEHAPDVVVTGAATIGETLIEAGRRKGLRGIVKAGTGMDNIDVAHARSTGVMVVNVPAYAAETVAELLRLALFRG
ncbi:MAG: D-3-phosphoglycerate dehydrogenase [Candidatus Kentron sp. G]|nr:MAG: D-3-phosphoglycerate dehydrogenase [Candidatus Kentron sp. G]VFN03903.1 MAG: D-3-phosphoglycerate dehydrogenase [Candidatus Kentron sp. G]